MEDKYTQTTDMLKKAKRGRKKNTHSRLQPSDAEPIYFNSKGQIILLDFMIF